MAVNIEKMRSDMRWETRKFAVSTVIAAAALVGAGIAIGNYFSREAASVSTPVVAQPQAVHPGSPLTSSPQQSVLDLPPGTTITLPGVNGGPPTVLQVQPRYDTGGAPPAAAPAPKP